MRTLNWRHTGWSARTFAFTIGQELIGQLTLNYSWNLKGSYTDPEANITFAQKSFLDADVLVTKDGKTIGEITSHWFGIHTLTLATGERYRLSTSLWEQEAYWRTEAGETVIKYQQATMSSMGKGVISLTDKLTPETEKILISSGLFARKAVHRRIQRTVAVFIPILAASRL